MATAVVRSVTRCPADSDGDRRNNVVGVVGAEAGLVGQGPERLGQVGWELDTESGKQHTTRIAVSSRT